MNECVNDTCSVCIVDSFRNECLCLHEIMKENKRHLFQRDSFLQCYVMYVFGFKRHFDGVVFFFVHE